MEKTLVYFASGTEIKEAYKNLPYDKIYLVDYAFRFSKVKVIDKKITCLNMDCLEAVDYLKERNIKIDCFVCLNEGLFEGGGSYPINSDFFIGYVMPIMREEYIHVMNPLYYYNDEGYDVTMDLPYHMTDITEYSIIDHRIFSNDDLQIKNGRVYLMKRVFESYGSNYLNSKIRVTTFWDSIWNHYDYLDNLYIMEERMVFLKGNKCKYIHNDPDSMEAICDEICDKCKGKSKFVHRHKAYQSFFKDKLKISLINTDSLSYHIQRLPLISDLSNATNFTRLLSQCEDNKTIKLGFYLVAKWNIENIKKGIRYHKGEYPKEICLFHLNKRDFNFS